MQFIVEFQLKPGAKNQAVAAFEQRGPNRNPGVTLKGAWIGSRSDVAFILVDGADEAQVAKAAESWAAFGAA
ncbi:MAG: DUF3303 family protein, partial [Verrucomicrobiales bacterium]|nr:DUF3303 family protein [Verrucomicrobiales bacterium]